MPVFVKNSGGPDKSKGLTATAADIARGKTALVSGEVVTGTNEIPQFVQLKGSLAARWESSGYISMIPSIPSPTGPFKSIDVSFSNITFTAVSGTITGGGRCNAGGSIRITAIRYTSTSPYRMIYDLCLSADGKTIQLKYVDGEGAVSNSAVQADMNVVGYY